MGPFPNGLLGQVRR